MLTKILNNKPFQNFIFISLYQGVNFLALIVFIPYLTKTIGVEQFGLVTIMQAICSFFYVLVDYGFSVTTVRKLSVHQEDLPNIEKIIKTTLGAKLLLLLIAFPVFVIIPLFFLKTQYDLVFVLLSFVAVIGQAAFPAWLCQGLEENKLSFYLNLINKAILCIFVLYFIKTKADYEYYLFFMGIASFVTGILLTWYVVKHHLKFSMNFRVSLKDILAELNEGKEVFFSNFSIGIYLSANVLILSLFVSPFIVGLYGIAERVMMLLRTVLGVFVQAIYPFVCKLVYRVSFRNVLSKVIRVTTPFMIAVVILCFSMAYFNEFIASFFTHNDALELAVIIRKLSFLPFLVALNIVPNLIILAYNKEKIKSYILLFSTGISFVLSFLLVPYFKVDGTISIMYSIELLVAIASIYYMMKLEKIRVAENTISNI